MKAKIETLRKVMLLAWQMVKRNGYTMSEALKVAWNNIKLKMQMARGITRFYFRKVDGTIREAFGTLRADMMPALHGSSRQSNDSIQVYYDTERQSFRSFKKANLIKFGV